MSTNLTKKPREDSSRKPFIKAPIKHEVPNARLSNTISTFEQAYQQLLHRRNNDFCTLDSPNLSQQLQHLPSPELDDPYRSALSTPSGKTMIALQRKKYMQMKQRIEQEVKQLEKRNYTTLKQLFDAKQAMLTFFLDGFASELEKECRDKADILKYLWNSSQHLLGSISEALTSSAKEKEKDELQNNLRSHIQYQGLLQGYQRKQIQLSQKSNMERVTIHKLVYELRFKRKEVNKLYRNQRLLVNRLNEYKSQNLHLQSTYIDLLCSLRDVPPERAQMLIKAREQVRKSQQVRFKITGNRKNAKNQIQAQLSNQKIEELQSLYEQIKEIANNEANSPHLISTLIAASIENFGIKNDDTTVNKLPVESVTHKQTKLEVGIQINGLEFEDKTKTNHITQFGYIQRLKLQLINHRDTQTYCQYPKKKLMINVSTQIEPLEMAKFYVKQNFLMTRVIQESFKFQCGSQTTLKIIGNNPSHLQKRHRKNYSELNSRKSIQKFSSKDLKDFIEEREDQSSNSRESLQDVKYGIKSSNKRISVQKSSNRMLNKHVNSTNNSSKKERYTSILSNSSIKLLSSTANLDYDLKKSNFAPYVSSSNQHSTINNNETQLKNVINDIHKPRLSAKPQQSMRKSVIPKFKKNQPIQSVRHHFMQKTNYFNIEIDAVKQQEINNMFSNHQPNVFEPQSDEQGDSKKQIEAAELENLQRIKSAQFTFLNENQECLTPHPPSKQHIRKNSGMSVAKSIRSRRPSSSMKYGDQNQLLLNLCRVSYYKTHKKVKERMAVYKYRDEFTCVRDKIQFVARDVKELLVHREPLIRKTMNTKNLKNTYKILMMTFTKAYDAYNKGVLKGNLIYPLFESFALLYGNINNNQIYRKMMHFIAGLSLSRQNAILRFFLFFLGLDTASPYSGSVTVSEVFLCLKLLEKISVDGKVTLNIQSIYTDTTRIKSQLLTILKQQKIPSALSQAIDTRVVKQLQNSCLYKNSSAENSHLKLNIYNIILLVIQEVIKCKNSLRDAFMSLLMRYEQFKANKKIPVYVIQILLADWKAPHFDPFRLRALLQVITKNGRRDTVTIEQFCSILFECGLVSIDQLHQKSEFVYRHNWSIPKTYIQEMDAKKNSGNYASILDQRQLEMYFKLKGGEQNQNIQKMRRILFEKYYQRKVQATFTAIIGSGLKELTILKQALIIEQK